MELSDTFKCAKLHSTITVRRCLLNQREAIEFWGAEAVKFNSCPCEKGEEIKEGGEMEAKRGTCNNCLRQDMAIQKRGDFGDLCASCGAAVVGLSGSMAESALAEKKEKYKGKGKLGPGRHAVRKRA